MKRLDAPPTTTPATAVLLAVLLTACGGSSSPTAPPEPSPVEVEYQSADAVNTSRQSNGLETLRPEQASLLQVAREHSEAMRVGGFLGHVDPDGRGLGERLRDAGISFALAGENVARIADPRDPAGVAHSGFMQSPEHRQNILNEGFELVAVGVVRSGDTFWFTQIFICP